MALVDASQPLFRPRPPQLLQRPRHGFVPRAAAMGRSTRVSPRGLFDGGVRRVWAGVCNLARAVDHEFDDAKGATHRGAGGAQEDPYGLCGEGGGGGIAA